MNNLDNFVDRINGGILGSIDYDKLHNSYSTKDKEYAKAVLNELTRIATEEYGSDYLCDGDGNDFVLIPGVVVSRDTKNICVVLLELDLESSGEHYNTFFLTKHGCLEQFNINDPEETREFIRQTYGSYEYAYSIGIESDHHVDFGNLDPALQDFLDTFEKHTDVALSNKF